MMKLLYAGGFHDQPKERVCLLYELAWVDHWPEDLGEDIELVPSLATTSISLPFLPSFLIH
jgi:hypothetical protein